VRLASGKELGSKGLQVVPAGDRVIVAMPGGGGMGPPNERDPAAVRRDIRLGYVTKTAARAEYGFDD
jgi:N-methylhydantoinase B